MLWPPSGRPPHAALSGNLSMADNRDKDRERDARIEADIAFLEELEAMEAEAAAGIAVEASLDDLDSDGRDADAATDEPRGDIAARLRDPNLRFGSLRFLSGLTRGEAGVVRDAWPTLTVERRRRLVRAMGDLADLSVTLDFARALRVALRDTDAQVRRDAVAALWEDESPDLLVVYLDLLERDTDAGVRQAAARALAPFAERAAGGEVAEPLAGRLHARLLATAQDPREPIAVRRSATEAAGVYDDAATNALITDLYDRGELDDRVSALAAMGRSCDARWLGAVQDEVTAAEREARVAATRALGEIGRAEGVPDIIGRLADEERAVRFAAIVALGQVGSRSATNALREHRADEDDEDWTNAIDAALAEAAYGDQPLFPL